MSSANFVEMTKDSGGSANRHSLPGMAYALDNADANASDRMYALSEMFDVGTIRHLEDLGVTRGWHCLEVGGGGGSIAAWLSERVGPSGRVVVTDINTRFLENLKGPNLEVLEHNIVTDPLPEAAFDLVHARLVLMHLPERDSVLPRLVAALKPGGWLIDEEFDVLSMLADRDRSPSEEVMKTEAAMLRILTERGADMGFGRSLYGRLRALGLADVNAQARLLMLAGRSAGRSFLRSAFEQLREAMIGGGHITAEEYVHDIRRLDDPNFATTSPTLWAAWGRRPSSPSILWRFPLEPETACGVDRCGFERGGGI